MFEMLAGKVKWFNDDFGYGFIELERGKEDIFVHYSVIQGEGYRTLRQGQTVGFEIERGPKGDHATVVVVEKKESDVRDPEDRLLDRFAVRSESDREGARPSRDLAVSGRS
jgi:cold shock protein